MSLEIPFASDPKIQIPIFLFPENLYKEVPFDDVP